MEHLRKTQNLDEDVGVNVSIWITSSFTGPARHRGHVDVLNHDNRGASHAVAGLYHRHVNQ